MSGDLSLSSSSRCSILHKRVALTSGVLQAEWLRPCYWAMSLETLAGVRKGIDDIHTF